MRDEEKLKEEAAAGTEVQQPYSSMASVKR